MVTIILLFAAAAIAHVLLSLPVANAGNGCNFTVLHKGGDAPKAPKEKEPPPPPPLPPPPPPPKPPTLLPPPPTTSSVEVKQAEVDQRRQAARRNGIAKTLLAGETSDSASGTGKKTLLG